MKIKFSILFLLFSFNSILGCSYIGSPDPPLDYIAAKTSKIFLGEVISKTVFEEKFGGSKYIVQRIKFNVVKSFKGTNDKVIEIRFYEKKRKSSCDDSSPDPQLNEKWMIFDGYDEGDYIRFTRDPRWLNFRYDEDKNKDFTAQLENYIQKMPTALHGQIEDDCFLSACDPVKNAEIKIIGEYVKLETKTDNQGRFSFENIPPGKYNITIFMPYNATEIFMNWGKSKDSIFDAKSGRYFLEHETYVKFRDVDYSYFVFAKPSKDN